MVFADMCEVMFLGEFGEEGGVLSWMRGGVSGFGRFGGRRGGGGGGRLGG